MKKMIALLIAVSLALAMGGCKSVREPETATAETAAESDSQTVQARESESRDGLGTSDAASDEAQEAEGGESVAEVPEVQEDTFEDE